MLPVIEITLPPQIQGGNVPAFLAKLWKMVNNPDADNLIGWSKDGGSFFIKNQGEFTKTLLPYYYKHSNMASFVRQLNMYGFHKVTSVESGGLKGDNEEVEFAHPYFLRGQEHLLDQIKRKVNPGGGRGGGGMAHQFVPSIKNEKVTEVLSEVTALKERQEDIDSKLENMRSENDALWGEVMSLRQKHSQQQKIVNKLIQFLSALLQPRGMKRSFGGRGSGGHAGAQLAIEDTGGDNMVSSGVSPAKHQRLSEGTSGAIIEEIPSNLNIEDTSQLSSVLDNLSRSQPSAYLEPVVDIIGDTPVASGQAAHMTSDTKYTMVDPVSVNSSLVKRPGLQRELSREDFDSAIINNEKDLDNLKDILSGQITLDSSLVSSLFNVDQDPTTTLFSDYPLNDDKDDNTGASGVKPVTYNPSLFELAVDDGEGNILQGSEDKFFNETVLHTPLVQDDNTNPLAKLLGNK